MIYFLIEIVCQIFVKYGNSEECVLSIVFEKIESEI